jgi:hypothetical protein
MAFENTAGFPDFQAEYEGSIPFTRSNVFRHVLDRCSDMALNFTSRELSARQAAPAK